MNFCKDCKWIRLNGRNIAYAQCVNPKIANYNPVSGVLETYCETERKDFGSATSKCGPDGNLFEPIDIQQLVTNMHEALR